MIVSIARQSHWILESESVKASGRLPMASTLQELEGWAASFRSTCLRCPVGATNLGRAVDTRRYLVAHTSKLVETIYYAGPSQNCRSTLLICEI